MCRFTSCVILCVKVRHDVSVMKSVNVLQDNYITLNVLGFDYAILWYSIILCSIFAHNIMF